MKKELLLSPVYILKTGIARFILIFAFLLIAVDALPQLFDPGILYKESDYARMREKIAKKEEPYWTAWKNLLASPYSSTSYTEGRTVADVSRPGNYANLYRDATAINQIALVYKINGNKAHGDKAVKLLNNWSKTHKSISGNAERYLAAGTYAYMMANAAEMMKDHPDFDIERFRKYLQDVFYKPMVERFLLGNEHGAAHNDACCSNYRANWETPAMASMAAIGIFCERKDWYEKSLRYFTHGCEHRGIDPTGCIKRAVPYIHTLEDGTQLGQWEESGRDQGHTIIGFSNMVNFLEIVYNQGDDLYAYDDSKIRKAGEYIARYNLKENDEFKYTVPYTPYSRQMSQGCNWHTESNLDSERMVRGGKPSPYLSTLYNHYLHRAGQDTSKVKYMEEALSLSTWGCTTGPNDSDHPDNFDILHYTALTKTLDSCSSVLPWSSMDVYPVSISLQPQYGKTRYNDDKTALLVDGSGVGIGGTSDAFQFAFQRLLDKGSVVTKISGTDEDNPSSTQAGLMIRGKLSQESANVFLAFSPNTGITLTARSIAKGETSVVATKSQLTTSPCWLKLTYDEGRVEAYYSATGMDWELVGQVNDISFPRDVYVGPAVSSQDKTKLSRVQFEGTELTRGNVKPFARITAPSANLDKYVAPALVNLSATAADLDGSIAKVEILLNGELVETKTNLSSSEINYSLKNLSAGQYKVNIKAYDNAGAIAESDTISLTVKETEFHTNKGILYDHIHFSFDNYPSLTSTGVYDVDTVFGRASFLSGAALTQSGKEGSAVELSGNGAHVKLPFNFIHKLSDFTIALWVKMTKRSSEQAWCRLFDFGSGTEEYMFFSPYNGSGQVQFGLKGGGREQSLVIAKSFPLNTWTHLTVTLLDNKLTVYLNGTEYGSSSDFILRPYDIGSTTGQNYLGKSQWSSDGPFVGAIDEFYIFNRGMTREEAQEVMLGKYGPSSMDIPEEESFMFYPNPAYDEITIENRADSELIIFNSTGQLVYGQTINSSDEKVNINHLTPGIYILQLKDGQAGLSRKLLIKK
ncbi:alginate lyase family protein [Bacteroidales bacterium OttesenSCG-928-J19]|nr:alginate lyase family protein [Bacteroidales bacterium OttesenSCG-928-J19]